MAVRHTAHNPVTIAADGRVDLVGALLYRPPAWMADGTCTEIGGDHWYPDDGGGGSTVAAKRICAACPVREPCLQFALEHEEQFGVWGGLSERERRKLKPGQNAPVTINQYKGEYRPGQMLQIVGRCRDCGIARHKAVRGVPQRAADGSSRINAGAGLCKRCYDRRRTMTNRDRRAAS